MSGSDLQKNGVSFIEAGTLADDQVYKEDHMPGFGLHGLEIGSDRAMLL